MWSQEALGQEDRARETPRHLLWERARPRGCRNSSFPVGGASGPGKAAWKQLPSPSLPASGGHWPWILEIQSCQALKGSQCGDHSCIPRLLFLPGGGCGRGGRWGESTHSHHPSLYPEGACSFTRLFFCLPSKGKERGLCPFSLPPKSMAWGTMSGTEQALQTVERWGHRTGRQSTGRTREGRLGQPPCCEFSSFSWQNQKA